MFQRHFYWLPLAAAAGTLALLASDLPLGILGEWVWNRSPRLPAIGRWFLPAVAGFVYIGFVLWGRRRVAAGGMGAVALLLPLLLVAAFLLHAAILDLPDIGWGVERWPATLYFPATSGYFTVARTIDDGRAFLAHYETWIQHQDNFHIGTHPPGLIVIFHSIQRFFEQHPRQASSLVSYLPERFMDGLVQSAGTKGISIPEQATLAVVAILTWVTYLWTILPIYANARLGASRENAWLAAAAWPLVPAGPLFLPVSDCLFPFVSASLVWLMLQSPASRLSLLEFLAGSLLVLGLFVSLAFLAILPIAIGSRLLHGWRARGTPWRGLIGVIWFAAGTVSALIWFYWWFDVNLIAVWRENLAKHAGFYDRMPRTYFPWIGLNLVEFAISTGPIWFVAAFLPFLLRPWFTIPASRLGALQCGWWMTMILLDLSGRNLSETARLWILLTPFACTGLGWYLEEAPGTSKNGDWALGFWLIAELAVVLALVAGVEPLLPVHAS
ncbi:MAG: hypothetical protein U1D30_08555 [Planctomycetota bacterium]